MNSRWTLGVRALLLALLLAPAAHADLIVSQYYDGDDDQSKFIEIANVGSSSIDLTSPQLYMHFWSNPDADPSDDAPVTVEALTGTIAAGQSLVLANQFYDAGVHGGPTYVSIHQQSGAVYFEGDDVFTIGTEHGGPFLNDATRDSRATLLGSDDPFGATVLTAYVGVAYGRLYVAYTDAGSFGGNDDVFIHVYDTPPEGSVSHPWRNGNIPPYDYHYFQEGDTNFKFWYDYDAGTTVAGGDMASFSDDAGGFWGSDDSGLDNDGYSVAMIDLANLSNQDTVWVAVAAYGGDHNQYYHIGRSETVGDAGWQDISAGEVLEVVIADVTVDEYPWAERTNVVGTPGSTWAAANTSYYRNYDDQSASTTWTASAWTEVTLATVDGASEDQTEYLGTHRYGQFASTTLNDSTWQIIGVPTDLVTAGTGIPTTLFGDDIAEDYGEPNWVVSRYNMETNSYDRFVDAGQQEGLPAYMSPGLGYWMIYHNANATETIDVEISQNLGQPVTDVSLTGALPAHNGSYNGRQMFANPFNATYTVSQMTFGAGGENWATAAVNYALNTNVYTWDPNAGSNGDYATESYLTATLDPWDGFWLLRGVASVGQGAIDVNYPTAGAGAGPMASMDELDDEGDWSVQIQLQTTDGRYVDNHNRFGVKAVAAEAYDPYDAFELNRPTVDYVSFSFLHGEWPVNPDNYTFDYRGREVVDRKVWTAQVKASHIPGAELRLTWPDIDQLDPSLKVELYGERTVNGNSYIGDLREMDEFVFTVGESNLETRRFHLVVTRVDDDLTTDVAEGNGSLPESFQILAAYPNPFNDELRVQFALPQGAEVRAEVIDLLGRRVATLAQGRHAAGVHDLSWQARNAASGVYFLHLSAGDKRLMEKVVLLR